MEERGFDALQHGAGAALLVWATVLLIGIIIAGGLYMQHKERQWRAEHPNEGKKPDESGPTA